MYDILQTAAEPAITPITPKDRLMNLPQPEAWQAAECRFGARNSCRRPAAGMLRVGRSACAQTAVVWQKA
jgi:hypothetical protein